MTTRYEIERFNRKIFSLWKLKMKAILRKDNGLEAIEGNSGVALCFGGSELCVN